MEEKMTKKYAFWEWMVKRGYVKIRKTQNGNTYKFVDYGNFLRGENIPPQMLIGYFIEYLRENRPSPLSIECSIECVHVNGEFEMETIDRYAKRLEKEIERL